MGLVVAPGRALRARHLGRTPDRGTNGRLPDQIEQAFERVGTIAFAGTILVGGDDDLSAVAVEHRLLPADRR